MKLLKYVFALSWVILTFSACQKNDFDDTSFVSSGVAPENLSLLFDITQDNSGNVTILPNGEGVSLYEVYFGDTNSSSANIQPGKSVTHQYGEGKYNVKLIAHNLSGKSTEINQELTVTFRAPENLEVVTAIDKSNNLTLKVSASALYETNFRVYFGETPNETPKLLLEGQEISHTYAKVGTYTLRVVAVSGGAATTEMTRTINIVDPLLLPIDFESPTIDYSFVDFDGGNTLVINNPYKNNNNGSTKVARMIKNPGQPWGGSVLALSGPVDFSAGKVIKMKLWSPKVGSKVLFKLENSDNGALNIEQEIVSTIANDWEEVTFDFSNEDTDNEYHNIVLIFENGTNGDGTSNFTYYFDDIRLVKNSVPLALPLTFENTKLNYDFTHFDGGVITIEDNDNKTGINTSAKVAKMVKYTGQTWGGSFIILDNPIDFSAGKLFKVKVWSPRIGAKILLKVENTSNSDLNFEKEVATTKSEEWEELTFDYSAINTSNSYQKIVFIVDMGTVGDGSSNFTFYFDDINLTN